MPTIGRSSRGFCSPVLFSDSLSFWKAGYTIKRPQKAQAEAPATARVNQQLPQLCLFSFASRTMTRAVSSASIAVLSTTTASAARTSGDISRSRSRRSRGHGLPQHDQWNRCLAFFTQFLPAALRADFGGRVEIDFQIRMRKHDRADVATFHDYSALLTRPALFGHQGMAHSGNHRDHGRRVGYLRRTDPVRNVFAVQNHVLLSVSWHQVNSHTARQRRQRLGRIQRNSFAQRLPRDRAVHRSAIKVRVAQQFRDATRHRAFPRTHWAVNRND